MNNGIDIKFNPAGFAECLKGLSGQVEAEATKIANRATGFLPAGCGGFHVEMSDEPRYKDSSFGVSRPIARVVANDKASSIAEAKDKILSKAVNG